MTQLGIPTEAFKANSLRGATATHLMLNGMEPQWVQSRGVRQSPETMQNYYNRIHQQQDWEAAFKGKTDASKHCFNCVFPALTSPQTEADKGRRRGEGGSQGRHNTVETMLAPRPLAFGTCSRGNINLRRLQRPQGGGRASWSMCPFSLVK